MKHCRLKTELKLKFNMIQELQKGISLENQSN
jgi:hypothetical protein